MKRPFRAKNHILSSQAFGLGWFGVLFQSFGNRNFAISPGEASGFWVFPNLGLLQ
jgi:hypothetical protein